MLRVCVRKLQLTTQEAQPLLCGLAYGTGHIRLCLSPLLPRINSNSPSWPDICYIAPGPPTSSTPSYALPLFSSTVAPSGAFVLVLTHGGHTAWRASPALQPAQSSPSFQAYAEKTIASERPSATSQSKWFLTTKLHSLLLLFAFPLVP